MNALVCVCIGIILVCSTVATVVGMVVLAGAMFEGFREEWRRGK